MPLHTLSTCLPHVSPLRPQVVDRRHVSWDGRCLMVIPKFDVLRV